MTNFGTMGITLSPLDDRTRDYPDDETDETDAYVDGDYGWTGWPTDGRWRPVTAMIGGVVALGAIATAVIINSGDSASTKATVGVPAPHPVTSAPATSRAPVPPSASPSPSRVPQLPAETFTTVAPPRAAPGLGPSLAPNGGPAAAPTAVPPLAAPPTAALNPRTVVYSVTGTKQLLDLVNIVYTDARGYPQTEFNVSLPWSKMVVLNPDVQSESVVATSFYGQLNCSMFNAAGQLVVTSAHTSNLATCAR
jgi:hypothetical protein